MESIREKEAILPEILRHAQNATGSDRIRDVYVIVGAQTLARNRVVDGCVIEYVYDEGQDREVLAGRNANGR